MRPKRLRLVRRVVVFDKDDRECMSETDKRALQEELLGLSFLAYEQAIRLLLTRMGYFDVQIMGRRHLRGRRKSGGGFELRAKTETGVTQAAVVVMLKQYRRQVQRRFIDELNGVMDRIGAEHGMLVTTSSFPDWITGNDETSRMGNIELIDAPRLFELLSTYRVGVRRRRSGRLVPNHSFFAHLHALHPNRRPLPSVSNRPSEEADKGSTDQLNLESLPTENKARIWEQISTRIRGARTQGGGMTWRTHAMVGISALWLLEPVPHLLTSTNIGPLAIIAAFGALLPDLDAAHSKIQALGLGTIQPFRPIGRLVHNAWGHRGRLHSVLGLGGAGVLAIAIAARWGGLPALSLWLGYASHIAADMCTRSGVALLGGSTKFHLLPKPLRFVTGSLAEDALLPFLAASILLLILAHYPVK